MHRLIIEVDSQLITQLNIMRKGEIHRIIRKSHRYLGVILGVQFLAWTIGGLYFSWTNIDEIRGDNIRKEKPMLIIAQNSVSISTVTDSLKKVNKVEAISNIQMIDILGETYYQITYLKDKRKYIQLANAQTGKIRKPLLENEAIEVAKRSLITPSAVEKVSYITTTNGHHEYREKTLPAYAVSFGSPNNTTVYVSAEAGTVQSFRNNKWRVFDFLWMLHTMDFENRDNINNWLLRGFSIFGIITLLSGFMLFFVSRKK